VNNQIKALEMSYVYDVAKSW